MMIKRKIAAFLCLVMCLSSLIVPTWAVGERDITEHETCAEILKQLGLFRGVSETDFDLERAPTRIEALVMLIRVLGKEEEALNGTWRHPFEDVPAWAAPYVGYAYVNGLTNGVSPTQFGSGDASAANYLTFMLRALGYSDTNGLDFTWDNPFALAENVGILHESIDVNNFWRADVAAVSFLALSVNLKGSSDTLADKLISAGAFTLEQYGAAMNLDFSDVTSPETPSTPETEPAPVTPPATGGKLNAEQISEKCAPAVFYIEVYGYNGALRGSGSGFFITGNGYAITNFHVVENTSYMIVTTVDGKKYESVKVIDVDRENDLALIKVGSSNRFPYLEMGDSDDVKQGQTIYAIGSPRGLENTLSQGIVSNSRRVVDEKAYIQLSAQIDSGSSGGALINEYGKVIGVTTLSAVNNTADLNLAVPINKAIGLNKNNPYEVILWNVNNSNSEDAINSFGYITGIDLISTKIIGKGVELKYDATDIVANKNDYDPLKTCLGIYDAILQNSGFTVNVIDGYTTRYTHPDKTDGGTITVILDKDAKAYITIRIETSIAYYKDVPSVPDFGEYSNLAIDSQTHTGGVHTYRYKYTGTYTLEVAGGALAMYTILLEEYGFQYSGESTMANGKDAEAFVGSGLKVNCRLEDQGYIYIEISPADLTPQTAAIAKLTENLKSKGTYDAKSGSYKYGKTISKVLYNITLTEQTGVICFSSTETVSAKNVSFADDMGVSGTDTDVTMETYIYLHPNGDATVTFICTSGNHVLRYEASFNEYNFSQNSSLTAQNNAVPSKIKKEVHDKVVFQMVRTLNGCKAHLIKNLGVSFAEIGFSNF